jgi:integrase
MIDQTTLAPWVRRFLLEHLITERNLARNTQRSYRDTLRLLLPFIAAKAKKPIDRLEVTDLNAERIRQFLLDLEQQRHCGIATRNQRLAAIRSLAYLIGLHSPQHLQWCGQIRAISFKKAAPSVIAYLEKAEMDALLAAPDCTTAQGCRDHALLLFLYNTGARADEAAQLTITDLAFAYAPHYRHTFVAGGSRHQYNPSLAWSCLRQHHQRVCRSGSGDEGQGLGALRSAGECRLTHARQTLARGRGSDGLLTDIVSVMWRCSLSYPKIDWICGMNAT